MGDGVETVAGEGEVFEGRGSGGDGGESGEGGDVGDDVEEELGGEGGERDHCCGECEAYAALYGGQRFMFFRYRAQYWWLNCEICLR